MFSPKQIHGLYDISTSKRLRLLQERGTQDTAMSHFLRQFHDPHEPGQAAKIKEQARDPTN